MEAHMSTDNEMVDLIKGAAQEGQLYKISTEEIQSIYQRGSAQAQRRGSRRVGCASEGRAALAAIAGFISYLQICLGLGVDWLR